MWLKTQSAKGLVYLWNYWQRNTGTPVYILVHCTIMRVLMREDRKDELKVRKYPGIDVIVKPLNFRCMDAQLMGIKTFEKNIS